MPDHVIFFSSFIHLSLTITALCDRLHNNDDVASVFVFVDFILSWSLGNSKCRYCSFVLVRLCKQYLTKVEVNVRKKTKHVLKINTIFIISREPSTMFNSYGTWTYCI